MPFNQVFTRCAIVCVLTILAAPAASVADEKKIINGEELTSAAVATVKEFVADEKMEEFRTNLKKAHGAMIVPKWTRAGLIIGGSGGNGVVLVRKDGQWRGPAFYEYGGGSVGAQIGVSVQRIIMLIMQEAAVDRILAGKIKLGGGVSVAAGKAGTTQEVASTKATADDNVDILSYGKAKGLYAGLVAQGASMSMLDATSKAFYGTSGTPQDILISGKISSSKGQTLIDLLEKHSK